MFPNFIIFNTLGDFCFLYGHVIVLQQHHFVVKWFATEAFNMAITCHTIMLVAVCSDGKLYFFSPFLCFSFIFNLIFLFVINLSSLLCPSLPHSIILLKLAQFSVSTAPQRSLHLFVVLVVVHHNFNSFFVFFFFIGFINWSNTFNYCFILRYAFFIYFYLFIQSFTYLYDSILYCSEK